MGGVGPGLTVVAALLLGSAGSGAAEAPRPRHLIYLHGRIVQEQQSARPKHPQHGYYELDKILGTFRDRGFVVSGELRPKSASVVDSADQLVAQIKKLIASGVPADHITVVGASMGGGIALLASARLQNPDVRFCILGACVSEGVARLVAHEGKRPAGRILAVRESSDETTGQCPPWQDDPAADSTLVVREILLDTGLHHGFLYRPLAEWVNPVVEWAKGKNN